jgi:hypothetical protein
MSSSKALRGNRLLAVAGSILLCTPAARAAQTLHQQGRLCAPAVEMSAISNALAASGNLDAPAAGAYVTVRRDGDQLTLQNVRLGIDRTAALAVESSHWACATASQDERLAPTGRIPLVYAVSFAQTERYRIEYPPVGGADLSDRGTSTMMAAYGPYVLIMFWNKPDEPMVLLSCKGLEYYRVDPRTHAVLPFDGCVEAHDRVLPGLNQLPP